MTYKNPDSWSVDALQTANIDSLRVVSEPVAEIGPRDEHAGPLLALQESKSLENILDILRRYGLIRTSKRQG